MKKVTKKKKVVKKKAVKNNKTICDRKKFVDKIYKCLKGAVEKKMLKGYFLFTENPKFEGGDICSSGFLSREARLLLVEEVLNLILSGKDSDANQK